jgi:1-acyl-sn-glycerol-3-phosphate acyltransferase
MGLFSRLKKRLSRDSHEPLLPGPPSLGWWARWLISPEQKQRAQALHFHDLGHGHDEFGLSREGVEMGYALTNFLYETWFRVEHFGIENVPETGPVVLACNHSGMLPLDAMMVCADLIRHGPDRVPRVVMDYFVQNLPIVGAVFTRAGGFGGTRGNFHRLLDREEMVLVYPEGTDGIGKPFSQRYKLAGWRQGHAELAIRHGAPIVPIAVIGAEEQWPQLGRLDVEMMGAPYVPIPATLIPLPTHYRIWYGEPIPIPDLYAPSMANEPEAVAEAALRVRHAVEDLIAQGLEERGGRVFR